MDRYTGREADASSGPSKVTGPGGGRVGTTLSRVAALLFAAAVFAASLVVRPGAAQLLPEVTAADVTRWMDELSNWGRWGPDDEIGTLNLVTPEKRRAAAALVEEGTVVSLARDVAEDTTADNPQPLEHEARWVGGDAGFGLDRYAISYHGYAHSHLDGLAHAGVDGRLYNGYSRETVTSKGAERLGIEKMHEGVFTRGVLIDLPRLRGVPFLEPGTAVTVEELEEWERRVGVAVEPGDVVLIRTGRWVKRAQDGPWRASGLLAGLHVSAAGWLRDRDVAAVGCDGVTDVIPSAVEGLTLPLHRLALVAMGMPLFDNLDLDALAREAAARGRWTFLFTASPIRFPGGLGSPVNPTAVF